MTFFINLTQPGISREEFIFDSIKSLKNLLKFSEDIFNNIQKRIESSSDKIKTLKTRLISCNKVIDNLKDTKSAIVIESLVSYPDNGINYINSLFASSVDTSKGKKSEEYKRWYNCISDFSFSPDDYFTNSSYLTEVEELQSPCSINTSKIDINTKTVDSILLLNSKSVPIWEAFNIRSESLRYDHYQKHINHEENLKTLLGEIPQSLLGFEQENSIKEDKELLAYNPQSDIIPSIDFPSILPDLPNIIIMQSNLPNLSQTPLNILDRHSSVSLESISNNVSLELTAPFPSCEAPILQKVTAPQSSIEGIEPNYTPKQPIQQESNIGEPNSRANLLKEIKLAGEKGGLKLKKVNKTTNTKGEKASSAFDVFSELHDRLKRRREGIRGNVNVEEEHDEKDITDKLLPDNPMIRYMMRLSDDSTSLPTENPYK